MSSTDNNEQTDPQLLASPLPVVAKVADEVVKTESPQTIPQQLTTTASIALPDSKTPTPQPLKKLKSSTTPVPSLLAATVPSLPSDLEAADVIGGSPVRKYINKYLTGELITGIKNCCSVRPDRPLRWLGEWLIQRDEELLKLESENVKMTE